MIAANIPSFKLSCVIPAINPTKVGPQVQPKSPANASRENIAFPPLIEAEVILNVPGHKMPTEKPHKPIPIRERIGEGDNEIKRYEPTQSRLQIKIILFKFIFSPILPYIVRDVPIKNAKIAGPTRSPYVLEDRKSVV